MKKKITSIFYLVLVILLISCTKSDRNTKSFLNNLYDKNFPDIQSCAYTELSNEFEIEINYPKIIIELNNTDKEFNKIVKNFIISQVVTFRGNARVSCSNDIESSPFSNKLTSDYFVITNDRKIISVRFRIFIDWLTMENSTLYYASFNYDKDNNKLISILDFINGHFDNLEQGLFVLSKICSEKLYNKNEIECNSFWKNTKNIEVFEYFNLTKDGIQFIFDDYILESHECGNPIVDISLDEIILKKRSLNEFGFK